MGAMDELFQMKSDLGRFMLVPQPLKPRVEVRVPTELTADEALHRIFRSKNHQHHLAKKPVEDRQFWMQAFKDRWVGDEPYVLIDLDLAKLKNRQYTMDEQKVEKLMRELPKNPPKDDHPIIGRHHDDPHVILDGNHRIEAYRRLKEQTVKAYVPKSMAEEVSSQSKAARSEAFFAARKFERDLMVELGQLTPEEAAADEVSLRRKFAADDAKGHIAYLQQTMGSDADEVLRRAGLRARLRGDKKPSLQDIMETHRTRAIDKRKEELAKAAVKVAATVFLGGKVSGKDGNWREDIKDDLREAGHKVIDPKTDPKKWDPATDIYKEIKQILKADHVFFHKGGYFTQKEKEVCEAAGKDYETVKKPEEIVEKLAFNAFIPVDVVSDSMHSTPSYFPEDVKGHILTTLEAARRGMHPTQTLLYYYRNTSGPIYGPRGEFLS